jgi:hypothetical protein
MSHRPLLRLPRRAAWVLAWLPALSVGDTTPRHSLQEFAYLVGAWKCTAAVPGKPDTTYQTAFRWMYPQHTAIDQSITMGTAQANFMLTYDKASDSFKGVFVMDDGSIGVWENPGPENGGWTEFGYDVRDGKLVLATKATFAGVTPTHYGFRFWNVKTKNDAGKLIEADECDKL